LVFSVFWLDFDPLFDEPLSSSAAVPDLEAFELVVLSAPSVVDALVPVAPVDLLLLDDFDPVVESPVAPAGVPDASDELETVAVGLADERLELVAAGLAVELALLAEVALGFAEGEAVAEAVALGAAVATGVAEAYGVAEAAGDPDAFVCALTPL